jgi:Tfp pilus assembly protein PilF
VLHLESWEAHMDFHRSIDDIVATVRNAPGRRSSCSLLIGAGCSVKGGVPLAGEFVQIIKDRYPESYRRAKEKTYPQCMDELTLGERRGLIAEYVDKAKINWAHVGVACLMQKGYVDRVLTTNFDPLVMRACALLGDFPAVYDFAASQLLTPADIPDKAVFHLHGQRTGFVLMNTPADCQKQSERLGPVFQDAGRGRVWIVVGYSGENDPVFDHLARVDRFDNGLYWVGYQDSEPAPHMSEKLLTEGKYAFYVKGWDADSFFVTLTQRLGIFPPSLVQQPFTHLKHVIEMLSPFSLPREVSEEDVTRTARKWIHKAIAEIEQVGRWVADAERMLMAGDYDGVIGLREQYKIQLSPELAEPLSWAYVMQGNSISSRASTKTEEEADRLFAKSGEKHAAALDMPAALNNLGHTLLDPAQPKTGEEADRLFAQAGEKYGAAVAVKPRMHEAFYNWGNALACQAKTKTGEEADRLFAQAGEKYAEALAIKPDKDKALNNWGNALADQAKTKTGQEADRLFARAGEKYGVALASKPDNYDAFFNWGVALADLAQTRTGEEADRLFAQVAEKYAASLSIKPDMYDVLYNWGYALLAQADYKTGKDADRILMLAGEKYAAALAIKPDMPEALNNWGYALLAQAKAKSGAEAIQLFDRAKGMFDRVEEMSPGGSAYNQACVAALMGDEDGCRKWLERTKEAGTLPDREELLMDDDLKSVRGCQWFKDFLERAYPENP